MMFKARLIWFVIKQNRSIYTVFISDSLFGPARQIMVLISTALFVACAEPESFVRGSSSYVFFVVFFYSFLVIN